MNLFGKQKKEAEEDALIEKLTGGPEKQPAKEDSGKKGNSEAEMEKLSAQITAVREVIQAQQERFERQSEEIGELRSMIAEKEKQMRDIEAKAVKAAELVEEVQPESLMTEQKKADAKIEAVRAKFENLEAMSNNIIDELKKLKGSVSVFRGTEEIIKLNKEVKDEIMSVRKIEAMVEKHADHVEAMFTSFESNFTAFEKMKSEIKETKEICDIVKKENEKNGIAIKDMPRKEEAYQLKTSMQNALNEIKTEKTFYLERNAAVDAKINSLFEKLKRLDAAITEIDYASEDNEKKLDDALVAIERTAKIISERGI